MTQNHRRGKSLDDKSIWGDAPKVIDKDRFYAMARFLNKAKQHPFWTVHIPLDDSRSANEPNYEQSLTPEISQLHELELMQKPEQTQGLQQIDDPQWTHEPEDNEGSKSPHGQFLDQLALIFARAKLASSAEFTLYLNKNNLPKIDTCAGEARDNVTATALMEPTVSDHVACPNVMQVFIAKNSGPQRFDDLDDRKFASKLEEWYNHLNVRNLPPDPTTIMWKRLLSFWRWRHRYYVLKIKAAWDELQRSSLFLSGSLVDLGPSPELDYIALQDDCEHIQKLISWLEAETLEHILSRDSALNRFVYRVCWEDRNAWSTFKIDRNQEAPEGLSNKQWGRIKTLLKIVTNFKLLKTLKLFWKACISLSRAYPKYKIAMKFLPKYRIDQIDNEPFLRYMEQCSIDHPESKKDLDKIKGGVDKRYFDRLFHCELQVLRLHGTVALDSVDGLTRVSEDGVWKLLRYVGCSKLSCFFCWEVLRSCGFYTRNTHGKLCANCAFPLQNLPEGSTQKVVNCLARLNSEMEVVCAKVFREGLHSRRDRGKPDTAPASRASSLSRHSVWGSPKSSSTFGSPRLQELPESEEELDDSFDSNHW
ncbi:hypothetical protein BT63DRAFT_423257 [Microthyrium microscopicum]|uniref:Uncharacterized protein n=1 Tax=Microthyrium microscopicum TaxID=703497 RepID=A0A6A6UH37_9PEZI|nr:hypothetical protein BT63DRAFT_423257 [Microthyrium microscopicum]